MPLTPETWLDQFTVNLTTTGAQFDPEITQLANGNIFVCWTTNDPAGLGSPAGNEVFAQLFDPLGARIGVEFRLNLVSTVDNEGNAQVAALPDGGFIVVYHDDDIVETGGSNIRLGEFDANGIAVTEVSLVVFDSAVPTDPNYRNPRIAVSSATSVLIVYEEVTAGSSDLVGKIYNTVTDTYSAQFNILIDGDSMTKASVTVLANGNYVITGNRSFTDNAIEFRILDSAGGSVLGATFAGGTNTNGENDREASVTALTGGGFVIVWTNTDGNDTDILGRVYDAAGTQVGSFSAGDSGATNNNNEPVVTGLADGSFVVVYDNDELNELDVTHFDAAGVNIGTFTIAATGVTTPIVTDLGDGRFAVAWSDSAGEISMEILDTRDAPNDPAVYTPADWQVGTIGDDVFTAASLVATVHGHTGDDTITDNAVGSTTLFGDAGNDTIIVVSEIGSDGFFGGTGTDLIDWSASLTAISTFDLQAGTADNNFGSVELMAGFQNLIGTVSNDTILGSTSTNRLNGGAGNDTLNGREGTDTVTGGTGNDLLIVDNLGDVIVELGGGGTLDRVAASVTYVLGAGVQVEQMQTTSSSGTYLIDLRGNALSQKIFGNAGANVLNDGGAGGIDTLTGAAGNDTYIVNNAGTLIVEAAGGGTNDRVAASISFVLNADDDIERMTTSSSAGTTAINLTGNSGDQTMTGNAGVNRLTASNGTDILNGLGGSDTLSGGSGVDRFVFTTALGATNVDTITDFNVAADTIELENAVFAGLALNTLTAAAFRVNTTGNAGDATDRIIYNSSNGSLYYDSDGTGGAGRIRFAILDTGLGLTNADFFVV